MQNDDNVTIALYLLRELYDNLLVQSVSSYLDEKQSKFSS